MEKSVNFIFVMGTLIQYMYTCVCLITEIFTVICHVWPILLLCKIKDFSSSPLAVIFNCVRKEAYRPKW